MACFEDYEVLGILSTNLNSTCFKVKSKLTSEVFMWKAINYETTKANITQISASIEERKAQEHPALLHLSSYILHESTNTVYLVTEYCKHGSLENIIQSCIKTNRHLNECFIWSLLYKLAQICKTDSTLITPFKLLDTFVDIQGNVKLLNCSLDAKPSAPCSINDLAALIHQIVYLQLIFKRDESFPEYYSKDLHNLLSFLTNPDSDVAPTLEAILCHPTVLLKQGYEIGQELFIPNDVNKESKEANSEDSGICENINNNNYEQIYQAKLENVRKRDAQLKIAEQKLQEREHNVAKKEKKVALMERIVKEKNARAELYLKRARDNKPAKNVRSTYDKNDTSFSADCGDSIIIQTSRKLNMQNISKPPKFTRIASERRVRFKSHSPLKEMNIKKDMKPRRAPDLTELTMRSNLRNPDVAESDGTSSSSVSVKPKKKFTLSAMFAGRSMKKANSITSSSDSVSAHTYEDVDHGWEDFRTNLNDCQPINWNDDTQNCNPPPQWTDDSKRQAFDLLRLMRDGDIEEIKHTFL